MATCELIMLDRDTCGMPAEPCTICRHTYCATCFPEHRKVHQPPRVEPKKFEVNLAICTACESVRGATVLWTCSCGAAMEPLKAALKADGRTVVFYTEE
jgi:hypothetical protein